MGVKAHEHAIRCLQVFGGRLLTGSHDSTLKIFDLRRMYRGRDEVIADSAPSAPLLTLRGHTGQVLSAQMDTAKVVSSSSDKTVRVWSSVDGQQRCVRETPLTVQAVRFDRQGNLVCATN